MNAQTQAPMYPPQISHNPQQFYNYQPANATTEVNSSPYHGPVHQVGNVGGAFQFNQGSPVLMPQNGYPMPSQFAFQNNAATGIPGQMPAPASQFVQAGAWSTALFDCMDDPTNALTTAFFPCVTFGQIADVLDNGHTTCTTSGIIYAVAPCVALPYRRKLRQLLGLVEAPSSDLLVQSVFQPFALCQEYRELKNRGIDPALGYHGNLDKLNNLQRLTTLAPPKNQMMN